MKITIAKTAGFCMGVRRAVEMVLDASNKNNDPIYTYGPLIHNPQVLSLLKEKGISVINEVPEKGTGTILIRAHGVPLKTKEDLKNAGFNTIDATCPRVIKVQTIIRKHAEQGYSVIIIGDNDHPEVIGLLGYAGENGYVVNNLEDLELLDAFDKAIIVAQTTQNTHFFGEVKKWTSHKFPHYKIFNTICDSTEKRQAEVNSIAKSVDAVIVVGGYNSGNTQRLSEIAQQAGKPAFHIEKESELDAEALSDAKIVGITAGASTPNWIIKKVYRRLETLPYTRSKNWRKFLYAVQRYFLLTNIYVSLGAGCLSYACSKLQGVAHSSSSSFIAMLYVLSMHTFNNLTGRKADRYNDPDRSAFYEKNKIFLFSLSITSTFLCLAVGYAKSPFLFFLLFSMSVMGYLYNLAVVPKRYEVSNFRKLKDIPGSKTVLIAVAWGIVSSIFPVFAVSGKIDLGTLVVFLWSTCMAFVRTAFFDILDMQGDRIVGKETIPILLGEKRAKQLLKYILVIQMFLLFVPSVIGIVSNLGFVLSLYPLLMFFVIYAHERNYVLPGVRLSFLVETHFILAGLIALLWHLIP